jgi:hypothetical protein
MGRWRDLHLMCGPRLDLAPGDDGRPRRPRRPHAGDGLGCLANCLCPAKKDGGAIVTDCCTQKGT